MALPMAAQARTKDVFAGPPKKLSDVPAFAESTEFYPAKIKVAVGDTVRFQFRGFHSATFPARGKRPPEFALPDPANPVAGAKDAAGQSFWFNGQPRFLVNPEAGFPVGDNKIDGKALDGSGIPGGEGAPAPFAVKMKKAGTYTYHCVVHPGMKGKVTVLRKGKRVPSAASDTSAVAKQVAKTVRTMKSRADFPGPGGPNVQAGNDTTGVSLLEFFPRNVSVKVGETVNFRMSPVATEVHTVTFGPPEYLQSLIDGFIAPDTSAPQAGPPTLVVNPVALFASDPPPALPAYDAANHGNGFLNSGLLDPIAESPPPAETAVTFTKAGTYSYVCIVHGKDMKGTVTVTG
jgi:plastocyanin